VFYRFSVFSKHETDGHSSACAPIHFAIVFSIPSRSIEMRYSPGRNLFCPFSSTIAKNLPKSPYNLFAVEKKTLLVSEIRYFS
jgi:hypothetical protein